ncbi:hypothetical protein NL444_26945, partial [Klebsiella pneumoniae]|nr:hypothetical protein [Klebsiella pneumoniae]
SHLFLDEFQSTIDSHDSFSLLLLQQDRPDKLVDIRLVIQLVEFALHALVLLLLRLQLLAGLDQALELCMSQRPLEPAA